MTNSEIIYKEVTARGILTQDQADEIIMTVGELPFHTFAGWKARGYNVKKGEHAMIQTQLWKAKEKKEVTEDDQEINVTRMFLAKAFLFGAHQVEKSMAA